MARVCVKGLSIGYGTLNVLENLDLDVNSGEFIVLLGPSGCGKSTLLNAIAGLVEASRGQILIADRNVTWDEPKDRGIAMVFQSYALYPRMSVAKNLAFGLTVAGVPKAEIAQRVQRVAGMLQIGELLDRKPAQLSGGQRQRVAIGRALVRDVPVLLFDEPLSNLDAQLRAELRVELKRLHQKTRATMIYVTHDQIEALTLADRIAVMKDRVIQQLASPDDIYLRPANRFVASFVGSPAMNFVRGTLERGETGPVFSCSAFRLPLMAVEPAASLPFGPVDLGVRPEHLRSAESAEATLEAVVEMVEPMGADALVWCRAGDVPLSVRQPSLRPAPGDRLALSAMPGTLSVFAADDGRRLPLAG